MIENKIAFVVGGCGQIGLEVVKALGSARGKIVVLDQNIESNYFDKLKDENMDIVTIKFDCSDIYSIESNFLDFFEKFGVPDIFVNCSYPRTEDWNIIVLKMFL